MTQKIIYRVLPLRVIHRLAMFCFAVVFALALLYPVNSARPDLETLFRGVAPNLEFHMWEGGGHFLMMDKPKKFNEVVLAFLEKNKL